MDDWQGCLSPSCQAALVNARRSVEGRGGCVVTVEDFLLALLEAEPQLVPFLKARGVDQDELVRTIQCEQPIVTTVGADDLLSPQLRYWFATARECDDSSWLDWPVLLDVLAHRAERLQGKAYVAVLEQVGRWSAETTDYRASETESLEGFDAPVVITDSDWLRLAEDIAVAMMASPGTLFWLSGAPGAGKTCWLQTLLPLLQNGYLCMDLRRETEVMGSEQALLPVGSGAPKPVLVLDNMPPEDLLYLLEQDGHMARHLVPGYPGAILLLGSPGRDSESARDELRHHLGRPVTTYHLPLPNGSQHLAVALAHQPRIEKHWQVEICPAAITRAARSAAWGVQTSGQVIEVLQRAAARISIFAAHGPVDSVRIAGEMDSLRRQILVALARRRDVTELEQALRRHSLERAASEVDWHERKAAGNLRRVTAADVEKELQRLEVNERPLDRFANLSIKPENAAT